MTRRLGWLALLLIVASCTEDATAPGVCPNFCPGGSIGIKDTIFTTIIERDSAFSGYIAPYVAEAMAAANLPAVVSRPVFVMNSMITRVTPVSGDTTTEPIVVDSSRLRLTIVRRDTAATNLWVKIYNIPTSTDSLTPFGSLDPSFSATPIDSVSLNDLLSRPLLSDTATLRMWGDTIQTDSAGHVLASSDSGRVLTLFVHFDTLQAPLVEADSGRLGFGIGVSADSLASITISATESGSGPILFWFYHYPIANADPTLPDSIVTPTPAPRAPQFDSFVFNPPTPALDGNLAVGGAPSARSLLRVALPKFLHDSIDVVRATLILVPSDSAIGAPSDSFQVHAIQLLTDVGAKSPFSGSIASTVVHTASTDTVRIEMTDLVRSWALDTTATTSFMLGQIPEAASFTQIRFYSSRTAAFRPALQVTYIKRFPFGEP